MAKQFDGPQISAEELETVLCTCIREACQASGVKINPTDVDKVLDECLSEEKRKNIPAKLLSQHEHDHSKGYKQVRQAYAIQFVEPEVWVVAEDSIGTGGAPKGFIRRMNRSLGHLRTPRIEVNKLVFPQYDEAWDKWRTNNGKLDWATFVTREVLPIIMHGVPVVEQPAVAPATDETVPAVPAIAPIPPGVDRIKWAMQMLSAAVPRVPAMPERPLVVHVESNALSMQQDTRMVAVVIRDSDLRRYLLRALSQKRNMKEADFITCCLPALRQATEEYAASIQAHAENLVREGVAAF